MCHVQWIYATLKKNLLHDFHKNVMTNEAETSIKIISHTCDIIFTSLCTVGRDSCLGLKLDLQKVSKPFNFIFFKVHVQ